MIYKPHAYQDFAIEHVISNESCGLFIDMGLGKTSIVLTAIEQLMFQDFEVDKVLVIAPKRVAEDTWTTEAAKWDHLKHLKFSLILGTERQRIEALRAKADIYVINRENVAWLIAYYGTAFPFDMVVLDELSSFKSPKSIRFKALRQVRPRVKRVVGLTGTPAPNDLIDLWSQLYLLDQGERLGKTITSYREKYFTEGKRNGHIVYDYKLRKEGEKAIYDKIGDICVSMKAKDYLTLPPRIDVVRDVHLPKKIYEQYENFEREQILALADLEEITAVNAAALTNKLLQFANGAVYREDKSYYEVHGEKLEALAETIEAANGAPVLCFYQFKHDVERIMKNLKTFKPYCLGGPTDIAKWNRGEIPFLLAHPASAGHGLNMQAGGNYMTWYGRPWSLELYLQALARLDRQGQTKSVISTTLKTVGTMDEDVIDALDRKAVGQDALMEAVKARFHKYLPKKRFAA